jgi:hypothetical protein
MANCEGELVGEFAFFRGRESIEEGRTRIETAQFLTTIEAGSALFRGSSCLPARASFIF